jgi:hypothetical protein
MSNFLFLVRLTCGFTLSGSSGASPGWLAGALDLLIPLSSVSSAVVVAALLIARTADARAFALLPAAAFCLVELGVPPALLRLRFAGDRGAT